jgi:hypothetical protein
LNSQKSGRKQLDVTQNRLLKHSATGAGALVATKPRRHDEYPLSDAGLKHLHAAVKDGRIKEGLVGLARWQDRSIVVFATKPIGDVLKLLDEHDPREGPFGPCFWVTAEFEPDGLRSLNSINEY